MSAWIPREICQNLIRARIPTPAGSDHHRCTPELTTFAHFSTFGYGADEKAHTFTSESRIRVRWLRGR